MSENSVYSNKGTTQRAPKENYLRFDPNLFTL